MTDKEIFKSELDKLKEETGIGLSEWENGLEYGRMEVINALYKTLDSMQEESTPSVWHDAKEPPLVGKDIILELYNGKTKVIQTYDGDDYYINNQWLVLSEQKRYAYVDELLKL